jgi:hypothetical protein
MSGTLKQGKKKNTIRVKCAGEAFRVIRHTTFHTIHLYTAASFFNDVFSFFFFFSV